MMNWTKVLRTIKRHKRFLIATHINPDADALASQLAMCLYLKKIGKVVYAVHPEEIPRRFHFIPEYQLISKYSEGMSLDFDVAIVLDCGDLDRVDAIKKLLKPDTVIVNIDHHITNDSFGNINCVDPDASSTAEVLFGLFKRAGFRLTKDIAALLYLGIMTDTGSFRYDSTTARTHAVVSELMRFKFSVNAFYRKLYEQVHWDDLKLFLKVVNRFDKHFEGQVIFVELRKKMFDRFSSEFDVRDKIFNFLRAIRGVEVIVILSEHGPRMTRVNFRALGDKVDVADLAAIFKGGGHRKASGCVIHSKISEAKEKLLEHLKKEL